MPFEFLPWEFFFSPSVLYSLSFSLPLSTLFFSVSPILMLVVMNHKIVSSYWDASCASLLLLHTRTLPSFKINKRRLHSKEIGFILCIDQRECHIKFYTLCSWKRLYCFVVLNDGIVWKLNNQKIKVEKFIFCKGY